jgi:hypothetical protein
MIRAIRDLIYPICPECDGTGGSEGHYGGDWTGCFCCNQDEDREDPIVRIWFWQVWRHHYEMWKLNRWVDRQVKADSARWDREASALTSKDG